MIFLPVPTLPVNEIFRTSGCCASVAPRLSEESTVYRAPTGGAIGGAGGLAFTGSDVGWWIALGIVLLVSGLLLTHSARRKRRVTAD